MTRARGAWAGSATASLASVLATLVLSLMLAPALATTPAGAAAANAVRLESMQVEIWPEYDRPAALVILRGELAASVGLPAAVSLRIPASSGGPAAVAYANEKKGKLLNLKYERSDAADFITLRFTAPARFFHVEFYDRFASGTSERAYKYVWPSDLSVNWLDVVVQEPAGASNISVKPELGDKSTGSDGLLYRAAQLGPFEQGKALPIEVRYTKADSRTSAEILKLNAAAPVTQADNSPAKDRPSWLSPTILGAAALLVFTTGGVGCFLWWWNRRPQRPVGPRGGGVFCPRCGNGLSSGDRFCAKCGTAQA